MNLDKFIGNFSYGRGGRGFKASLGLIADAEKKLQAAIREEDWASAARLENYISGMEQILAVFEQVAK